MLSYRGEGAYQATSRAGPTLASDFIEFCLQELLQQSELFNILEMIKSAFESQRNPSPALKADGAASCTLVHSLSKWGAADALR